MFLVAVFVLLSGLIIAFMTIPRMWLDGLLSGLEALILMGGVLGLTALILSTWGGPIMVLGTTAYMGAIAWLPYVRRLMAYRQEIWIGREEAAKWQKTIAFDPKNQGAHLFLARALVRMGRLDEALKGYEEALRLSPVDPEARKEYNQSLQLQRRLSGQPWICPACAAENRSRIRQCFRCGAYLPRLSTPPPRTVGTFGWVTGGLVLVLIALWALGRLGPFVLLLGSAFVFATFYVASALPLTEGGNRG